MRGVVVAMGASLLLVQGLAAEAQERKSVIGLRYQVISEPGQEPIYRNLPVGMKPLSSGLVGDVRAKNPYAIATFQQGDRQVLWLEQSVSQKATLRRDGYLNDITWQVLDAVTLPKESSVLGGTICYRNGQRDSTVVPVLADRVLRRSNPEWFTSFQQVWKVNLQTKKLEAINPKGIRCENPAWGL